MIHTSIFNIMRRKRRILKILIFLIFIGLIVYIKFSQTKPKYVLKIHKNYFKDYKFILLWQQWWKHELWHLPWLEDGYNYLKRINCSETRCAFVSSSKRDSLPITEYDAVVFHGPELSAVKEFPSNRTSKQIYVFACQEAPQEYWESLEKFDNYFNYTSEF